MTLPDIKSKAQLDISEFRKGTAQMLADLRQLADLGKKVGTLKLTADLSAGKDFQRAVSQIRAAVDEMVPTDMQRRVNSMFAGFDVGISSAAQSAQVFEAQAAALRARISELSNAVRLTRAEFERGMGDATPEEIANLTANMNRLQTELQQVGQEAKQTFGQWSNEALKAEMATRTAVQTVEAANGRISRLGLASQVKLGASEALAQYGPQSGLMANSFVQLAKGFDQARISGKLFETQLKNNNVALDAGKKAAAQVADVLKITSAESEGFIGRLARQGMSAEQAAASLLRAGASAKLAGRSTAEGAENFVSAVEAGDSAMLASIGISENLSTYYQKLAKEHNKRADDLTKEEKAQAAYNLIMAAASDELGLYQQSLDGLTGSTADMELSLKQGQLALGEAFLPTVNLGTRLLVTFADAFAKLPDPIQGATGLLLLSAVAIGALYGPISLLVNGWKTLTTARTAAAGAAAVEAAAETAITGAIVRQNAAKAIQKFLLADVSVLWAKATSTAMLYSGGMHVATGSTVGFTGALTALKTAWLGFLATNPITLLAAGVGALALYQAQMVKGTTKVYEAMDAANEVAFEKTMARVKELQSSGTELGRAQARVLVLQQALAQAQQGEVIGVNETTGERIYSKPDEARIRQLQTDLGKARENVTLLYTEAQRRGALNLKLTEDQTKAVKELNKVLEGRQFDLKVSGMTDMQRDLAKLGKEFDDLREKFKEPFYVNGKLMDPAQTPALRDGLARLDAQLLAEQQATRKKYADESVKTARESALSVQRAEIEAMRDGAGKRAAQRQLEIDEINRATAEKTKALTDFPAQQKQLEEDARKTIAAKRRQWAAEDVTLARESAKRIADAEKAARDARISSMADGLQKEEALRAAALADLKASIAEQVKALESDPTAQAGVAAAGREQVSALIAQQARERAEALRAVNQQVQEAQQSARSAEIAAITDETQRRRAQREQELTEIRQQTAEKVRSLAGYGQQQVAVQEAARRTIAAKQRQWATEDEADAKARAQRIADAWERVAQAQFGAQQAGQSLKSSQYELGLARQLAAARDNAVQVAQIEQQAVRERARIVSEGAAAQYAEEQRRLLAAAQKASRDTKISAEERAAIWAAYYADLDSLGAKYHADEGSRLKQQEADARAAAEALRAAYLTESNKPIQRSENRMQELAWARDLSRSDAEILRINQEISAERASQIQALQGQLAGLGGVVLNAEQRRDVENRIKALQHDQTVALRDQQEAQKQLRQSVLDRLDAEAAYAEKVATSDAALLSARLQAKAALQGRLSLLDSQIAAEGREVERNALLAERLNLLGRIQEVQQKITAMPGEAEQRQVALLQAQRGLLLELSGLGDDSVAQAQARVLSAAEEVRLAQQKVALAETQASRETAQTELLGQQTALLEAQRTAQTELEGRRNSYLDARVNLVKSINEQENRALDLAEARARAELQLRNLADDAVASAEVDLDVTREKLRLIAGQLARGGLGKADQEALQQRQIELTGQQAQQERALLSAQRERARLLEGLADAQRNLNEEVGGGNRQLGPLQTALRGIADARTALARAERDYADAEQRGRPEERKAATEGLTAAIRAQRDAVAALAEAYRQQISAMDGVQESSQKLMKVAYGENYKEKPGTFKGGQEIEHLKAIQGRRDAAQKELIEALKKGDFGEIAKANDKLANQQKRLNDQRGKLIKNGYGNAINQTDGNDLTRQLADRVDALGIQADREAVMLDERARIADQEARAVMSFGGFVGTFAESAQKLGGGAAPRIEAQVPPSAIRLDAAGLAVQVPPLTFSRQALAELAEAVALPQSLPSVRAPATVPVTNHSEVYNFGDIHVSAGQVFDPRQAARDIRRELENDLRRSGKRCP